MVNGETYATVAASVVDGGVNTLAFSGQTSIAGDEELKVVIQWNYDPSSEKGGISGVSWFIEQSYSPITGYSTDEEFNKDLANMSSTEAKEKVDGFMNSWSNDKKSAFWEAQRQYTYGCLDIL